MNAWDILALIGWASLVTATLYIAGLTAATILALPLLRGEFEPEPSHLGEDE